MKNKLKILLAAENAAGIRVLRLLMNLGHDIIGVIGVPDNKAISSVWRFADDSGINTWEAKVVKDPDFATTLKQSKIDMLLAIRFPYIINKQILVLPTIGSYNVHTGPLPEYAGLNAVNWAIYNGETSHAVTLHEMTDDIDAGAIVSKKQFEIEPFDTGLTVTRKCIRYSLSLIMELVKLAVRDCSSIPSIKQELKPRHVHGKEIPQDGCIDWRLPAQQIVNFVRACDYYPFESPWENPLCIYGDQQVSVCKAKLTRKRCTEDPGTIRVLADKGVEVATMDKWVRIELVKYAGKYLSSHEVFTQGSRLYNGRKQGPDALQSF